MLLLVEGVTCESGWLIFGDVDGGGGGGWVVGWSVVVVGWSEVVVGWSEVVVGGWERRIILFCLFLYFCVGELMLVGF